MKADPNGAMIVRSTTESAHRLDMRVTTAVGEHEDSRRHLVECGCDLVQGFSIWHPLPRDALLSDFLDEI